MEKLRLKAINLGAREVLTREQLKNVLGGSGETGSGAGGTCTVTVTCLKGATITCNGSGANCHYENVSSYGYGGWVQCDSDPKIVCKTTV